MYFTYAIKSLSRNYIYVGITNCVFRRVREHNLGYNKKTKAYRPFELIYHEAFKTRVEARLHEKFLKSGSGKEFLKELQGNSIPPKAQKSQDSCSGFFHLGA